jgi:allantoin racemase
VRLLVTNCNTSAAVSALIAAEAGRVADPATTVVVRTPSWGVESAEGWADSYLSAASVLDLVTAEAEPFDAVVLAGFGEHGREGVRELVEVPVVDITEAAVAFAATLGLRYGIVTSLARTSAQIAASLRTSPLGSQACAGIFAIELPVLDLVADPEATVSALLRVGAQAVSAGAEVLILGCAGMSALSAKITAELGVPVVDGLSAGIKLAESLVALGLRTSNLSYPPPLDKSRVGRSATPA